MVVVEEVQEVEWEDLGVVDCEVMVVMRRAIHLCSKVMACAPFSPACFEYLDNCAGGSNSAY